jgi:putative phosphoesterase
MKIAIVSDTHDHTEYLQKAIEQITAGDIALGLHLGDYESSKILDQLGTSVIGWKGVWGNNDHHLAQVLLPKNLEIAATDFSELIFDDKKIFITHYPDIARIAALSGKYDACFHGHTHRVTQELIGEKTLLANPGEICGERFGNPSFGIYETENNSIEYIYLLDSTDSKAA